MISNPRILVLLAALGSVALLVGALLFQYVGGLAPCPMCIWQRWPHGAAIGFGALALMAGWRWATLAGAAAAATTGGIGVYHSGVERGWWEGPSTCVSNQGADLTTEELMDAIMSAPMVRCDEVVWEFLTLSMASWNAILSFGLAVVWVMAFRAWGQGSSSASQ